MTTAARPTWAPAKGGNEQGGTRIFGPSQKYSSRDIASHTTLKPRKDGQDTQEELDRRDLKQELEERERRHFSSKNKGYDGNSALFISIVGSRREVEDRIFPRSADADDADENDKSDDDSDEDDDDEDDEEALMAELELIRKERAEEKRRQVKRREQELKLKEAETIRGNPLLNNATSFNVKRRWDDDVVFKNQARGEIKAPKRFINDTIRSDFHRKFLQKYMK
ncbi:hypothetical protein E3N88_26512 [Mikania micrantha]|uniref:Uncharacterized protein n=1 Tax=Mikania micrantha TaxID=192012 RepID=A0A5N6N9P8_9ASTR|nr:hypothetical protein E3N88_26512 [Mikania micrantha]